MGDFDLAYNGKLISQKFPPSMSVEPMRYESYQPPLYYLLATPIYGLVAGFGPQEFSLEKSGHPYGTALTLLRLFGVLLAAISLILLYACAATIFPHRPILSISATAFAAALPMHAAMTASVNNDTLAELLILASVLVLLRWMRQVAAGSVQVPAGPTLILPKEETDTRRVISSSFEDSARPVSVPSPRGRLGWGRNIATRTPSPQTNRNHLLTLGLLLGFGLLTKIYIYALLPICILMILLVTWRTTNIADRVHRTSTNVCLALVPALLLGLPMWIRNMRFYGLLDPLGLTWHDLVVAGQPTLHDWITQHGWTAYWARAISFTFRSFWGVFGWLGIFLDARIYTLLTIFSAVVAFGLMWALGRAIWRRRLTATSTTLALSEFQRWSLLFLGLMLLMVLACYALYNTKFVQHQGRYLFWGLLPIGLLVAVGWRTVQRGAAGIFAGIFAGALSLWLATEQLTQVNLADVNKWTLLSGALIAFVLLFNSLLYAQTNSAKINNGTVTNHARTNHAAGSVQVSPKNTRRATLLSGIYQFNFMLPFMLLFGVSIITALFTLKISAQ